MKNGIGFDGSAVGLKSVKAGDMVLIPDLGTAFRDPFWEETTLSFICTTLEADTHDIFSNDPRNIAIQAEAYLKQSGIADHSRWGPEFEFYVFDDVAFANGGQSRQLPPGLGRSGLEQQHRWAWALHPPARRLSRQPAQGPALQSAQPDLPASGGNGGAGQNTTTTKLAGQGSPRSRRP